MSSKQGTPVFHKTEYSGSSLQSRPRRGLTKLIFRWLLPLAVLAVSGAAAFRLIETSPRTKMRPQKHHATLVTCRVVELGPQRTLISGMGTVVAAREVELKPQVSGEIIEISDDLIPGGLFVKGEMLLRLDSIDYRLAVRELATDVAKAKSNLQLERGNQLIARKEFQLLGERVSDQEKNLILRQPQLENLRATLEAAQVKLEQAQLDLARTIVNVPFNAVIQNRAVNLGTQADESTVLATLVGTDAYWVAVSIPVSQLRWIKIPQTKGDEGSPVRVYDSAAWGEGVFRRGRVIRLEAGLEEQGRMARLLIQVEDPLSLQKAHAKEPRMLIGSYVRVKIEGESVPKAAAIEREYIRNGNRVWIMDGGKLVIRPVEIAFRGNDQLLITGGIQSGEQLILTNLGAPVEGMALRITNGVSDPSTVGSLPGRTVKAEEVL
jgi:RND family efflux transporter MFP subunit